MSTRNSIHDIDLELWISKAIANPNSMYGAFVYDDMPHIKFPPSSWTGIVEEIIRERWQSMQSDTLFACVQFIVKRDVPETVKQVAVSRLLERASSVEASLLALDLLQNLDHPDKKALSASILRAYNRMKLWQKWLLHLDGRFRNLECNL